MLTIHTAYRCPQTDDARHPSHVVLLKVVVNEHTHAGPSEGGCGCHGGAYSKDV